MSLRYPIALIVSLATVSLAAGCSSEESTPPVGSVSVTAARTRVPVGSPLELTYHFELREPVTSDYTVFVHFVHPDGQVLWNDDHAPVTPTSSWRPGTPVEYTRTVFLPPGVLHPGDVGVDVGLYRDGERLPLDGPRPARTAAARAYRVVDLQLAPESENIFLIYQDGWYPDEFATGQPTRSWKWTQKSATVAFRHPKTDVELLIEIGGRPDLFPPDAPQHMTVVDAHGAPVVSFPVAAVDPVQHRVRLTSAQLGTADLAELRFELDQTFVPARTSGGQDTRELGVRVFNVHIGVQ